MIKLMIEHSFELAMSALVLALAVLILVSSFLCLAALIASGGG